MGGSNPVSKVIKKVTKPVAKVLDKIVPNEIKPALPYLAAAFPFLAPGAYGAMAGGLGSLGISNPMIQRALISGGLNLTSQAAQEGAAERGINPLSLALAAGTGALTAPGGSEMLGGLKTAIPDPGATGLAGGELGILDQAKNLGISGLQSASDFLSAGASPEASLMQSIKAAAPSVGMAATEQAVIAAQKAKEDYEKEYQGWQDFTGQQLADFNAGRRAAILASMTRAGLDQDVIDSTLASLGLRNGGRVGYVGGGDVSYTDYERSGVIYYDENGKPISKEKAMKLFEKQAEEENKANGGIIGLMGGGMPSMEMDYRGGGFIPVGAQERADDVPARLSKNEFVMTADAVRAAGGGSVNEGARRMYELMNNLEAKV